MGLLIAVVVALLPAVSLGGHELTSQPLAALVVAVLYFFLLPGLNQHYAHPYQCNEHLWRVCRSSCRIHVWSQSECENYISIQHKACNMSARSLPLGPALRHAAMTGTFEECSCFTALESCLSYHVHHCLHQSCLLRCLHDL